MTHDANRVRITVAISSACISWPTAIFTSLFRIWIGPKQLAVGASSPIEERPQTWLVAVVGESFSSSWIGFFFHWNLKSCVIKQRTSSSSCGSGPRGASSSELSRGSSRARFDSSSDVSDDSSSVPRYVRPSVTRSVAADRATSDYASRSPSFKYETTSLVQVHLHHHLSIKISKNTCILFLDNNDGFF